jgi:hypothetical protein
MKNNLVPKKIIADINKKLKATSEKQMSEKYIPMLKYLV